ncbi:hypothetical protein HPB48_005272 [Haemaphysalis longicornis]|uniref:Uncharacterized protein n=1 Tax=Haemaphysalis longicornis TaxID=44386 RepID=A0A9J6H1V1_HAELO|nr:hypothetical protein HPB48_005272 [Haemaphysalis longicornis]
MVKVMHCENAEPIRTPWKAEEFDRNPLTLSNCLDDDAPAADAVLLQLWDERALKKTSAKAMRHARPSPAKRTTNTPPTLGRPSSLADPGLDAPVSSGQRKDGSVTFHHLSFSNCKVPFSCSFSMADERRLRYGDPASSEMKISNTPTLEPHVRIFILYKYRSITHL